MLEGIDYAERPIRLLGLSVSNPYAGKKTSDGEPLAVQLSFDFDLNG